MNIVRPTCYPPRIGGGLNCPAEISFGSDVRRPDLLETRTTGDVLSAIQGGTWQDKVARVRSLPTDSAEQKAAKRELPFATLAGLFSYRSNDRLLRHSGQCGVDLDGLGDSDATAMIQLAVADQHCLAAFRSARGEGVRLLFRVPPCSHQQHPAVFGQVAEHVRRVYNREPDLSGSDVSRSSFVSFDAGLWFYGQAGILPIRLPGVIHSDLGGETRCVSPAVYGGQLALTCWAWYGRNTASVAQRVEGTVKTHMNLLQLGMSVALHAERIGVRLTERHLDEVFDGWHSEITRNGVQLRCSRSEYQNELAVSVRGAQSKVWFRSAADKWLRWTRHPEFPRSRRRRDRLSLSLDRLLFAIRRHCAESGSQEFFLGVRDAAMITGVHFNTGARLLRRLVADAYLEKTDARQHVRHAQTYRLRR